ncbi:MDMPI N domain containing protein [Streptomyces tsukubensis]|uniref:MDMPI N domain containing protein n=1 Tax=Streptomyces tsukubensis TaxID=83656 RepID=A0A1V4A1H6_9ACTN|nr:MDMPI N domain containing protein [Streptomyces tsukubensis]QFR97766.1 MDMPI N domain containing protein [Streptomyces tsukubensis]
MAACSAEETLAVEIHLGDCGPCAEEALRLRDAVGLLHPEENLDLDPRLRSRVLERCLGRRPPRIPVPGWAEPYDAETARLDTLLQSIGPGDWHAPVRLRWYEEDVPASRRTTVAGTIAHLLAVDGLIATALGLDDPLGEAAPGKAVPPTERTETYWGTSHLPPTRAVRTPWRDQSHALVRTVSFVDGGAAGARGRGGGSGQFPVSYGQFSLPLRDAMLDRAFECWIHATDIADAVAYPYRPPAPRHLNRMIDLAARLLPLALAARRAATAAAVPRASVSQPGTLHLEIEGPGGGDWHIELGPPEEAPTDDRGTTPAAEPDRATREARVAPVAHVALDGTEFCRLAAGHLRPEEAAAGQDGDRAVIRDIMFATASLSRL